MIKLAIKTFTNLSGYIILVISLTLILVIIWGFINAALSFNQDGVLVLLTSFDSLVIFVAIVGICGLRRQNGCMICVFLVWLIVFFFVFVEIGVIAIILPNANFDGDCTNSINSDIISIAHNTSLLGSSSLCLL